MSADRTEQLSAFFDAITYDPWIGVSHISLYCALLKKSLFEKDMLKATFSVPEIMEMSKIAGKATYHKCIRDLHQHEYIRYLPSHNHRRKSKAYFL